MRRNLSCAGRADSWRFYALIAEHAAAWPLSALIDFDPPRHGRLHLLQSQRQHAVIERCRNLLLVDLLRQREGATEMADIVFRVERFHAFVLGKVDPGLDAQLV